MSEERIVTNIQCDVEINVQGGNLREAEISTAIVLRQVAAMLEAGKARDDFHDLIAPYGRKVGTVYFDFSEGNFFPHPDDKPH
jgi:hypothetical protein